MRRYAPYFLLVPPVGLLCSLPGIFRGEPAFPTTAVSDVLSILVWTLLFCAFLGLRQNSRLTRLFVIAGALVSLMRCVYRFEIGETGLLYFLPSLFIICVVSGVFFMCARPISERNKPPSEKSD
jgi:hypothetical protein